MPRSAFIHQLTITHSELSVNQAHHIVPRSAFIHQLTISSTLYVVVIQFHEVMLIFGFTSEMYEIFASAYHSHLSL